MWHTICHVETCDMWHVRYFILWHVTVLKTMDGNTGNTDYYLKLLSHQIKRFDVSITILNTLRWTIPTLSFSMDWFDCVFFVSIFYLEDESCSLHFWQCFKCQATSCEVVDSSAKTSATLVVSYWGSSHAWCRNIWCTWPLHPLC